MLKLAYCAEVYCVEFFINPNESFYAKIVSLMKSLYIQDLVRLSIHDTRRYYSISHNFHGNSDKSS